VFTFFGNVLRYFRQEVERAENLEVAPRPATQIPAGRAGKAAAMDAFTDGSRPMSERPVLGLRFSSPSSPNPG